MNKLFSFLLLILLLLILFFQTLQILINKMYICPHKHNSIFYIFLHSLLIHVYICTLIKHLWSVHGAPFHFAMVPVADQFRR